MILAMVFWQRAVIAGVKGKLEHIVCNVFWAVAILIIQVGKAHAESVVVPGKVSCMLLSLVLLFYLLPVKSTICSQSV